LKLGLQSASQWGPALSEDRLGTKYEGKGGDEELPPYGATGVDVAAASTAGIDNTKL